MTRSSDSGLLSHCPTLKGCGTWDRGLSRCLSSCGTGRDKRDTGGGRVFVFCASQGSRDVGLFLKSAELRWGFSYFLPASACIHFASRAA
jgi:hypothetical protein